MTAHPPAHGDAAPSVAWRCLDPAVRAVAALLGALPERHAHRVAPLLGRLERGWSKQRSLANMRLFLGQPSWPASRWEQLWQAHVRHLGLTQLEFLAWHRLGAEAVRQRITVRGAEHLRAIRRAGRGALVLANHLGNFVSLGPCFSKLGIAAGVVGNPLPTPSLERRLGDLARRFGVDYRHVGRGIPAVVADTFRRGAVCVAFVDVSTAGQREVWLPFGNGETNVSLGPALLAVRHRVPVLCVTCRRLGALEHEVAFHPPFPITDGGDRHAAARQLTAQALAVVTAGIRQHPEQWWQWDWVPLRAGTHPAVAAPAQRQCQSGLEVAHAEVGAADHPAAQR